MNAWSVQRVKGAGPLRYTYPRLLDERHVSGFTLARNTAHAAIIDAMLGEGGGSAEKGGSWYRRGLRVDSRGVRANLAEDFVSQLNRESRDATGGKTRCTTARRRAIDILEKEKGRPGRGY